MTEEEKAAQAARLEEEVLRAARARRKRLKEARAQLGPAFPLPVRAALGDFYEVVVGGPSGVGAPRMRALLRGPAGARAGSEAALLPGDRPACLRGLRFSGWHPPPPGRRLQGDLAYLEAQLLDGQAVHLTATPFGFYVNRSRRGLFDPAPAERAHPGRQLLDVLLAAAPGFRKAWEAACARATERAQLARGPLDLLALMVADGRADAITQAPQWNAVAPAGGGGGNQAAEGGGGGSPHFSDSGGFRRHEEDLNRLEEDLAQSWGMDERGALRDWNEELRQVGELPEGDAEQRLTKARARYKTLADFHEAAIQGARGVAERQVAPLNPNEPEAHHVFAFNNIFFSYAVDSRGAYAACGGDETAHRYAAHDLRNVVLIDGLRLPGLNGVPPERRRRQAQAAAAAAGEGGGGGRGDDEEEEEWGSEEEEEEEGGGVHTLATAVVDVLGARLVAQSIIPGILTGDHRDKLVFGAVEYGLPLDQDAGFQKAARQIAEKLLIAEREAPRVPLPGCVTPATLEALAEEERRDAARLGPKRAARRREARAAAAAAAGATVALAGAVELKGIRGADGRRYLLDLVRATPRDANWVPKAKGGTGNYGDEEEEDGGEDLHYAAVLRHELVGAWARHKLQLWTSERVREIMTAKKAAATATAGGEEGEAGDDPAAPKENGAAAAAAAKENGAAAEGAAGGQEEDEEGLTLTEEEQADLRGMTEAYLQGLRLNVNVFMPYAAAADPAAAEADAALARDAAGFLWGRLLPGLTHDARLGALDRAALDGQSLAAALHQVGINVRYLGRLAALAREEERRDAADPGRPAPMPLWWRELLEVEMVARALKRVLRDRLRAAPFAAAAAAPGPAVLRALNCLLGRPDGPEAADALVADEMLGAGMPPPPKRGGGGGGGGGGKQRRGKHANGDVAAAAAGPAPMGGPGGADPLTPAALWGELRRRVRLAFRYDLELWRGGGWGGAGAGVPDRCHRLPLLRRACQKLGLRVASRDYAFASGRPFRAGDLLGVNPVAKGCVPEGAPTPEARRRAELARLCLRVPNGDPRAALALAGRAAGEAQLATGGAPSRAVAQALELTALAMHQAAGPAAALEQGHKALATYHQALGLDAAPAAACHLHLATLLGADGSPQTAEAGALGGGGGGSGSAAAAGAHAAAAAAHLRAYAALVDLAAGPHHPEVAAAHQRLGALRQGLGDAAGALAAYAAAAELYAGAGAAHDLTQAQVWRQTARVWAMAGDAAQAARAETQAAALLARRVGAGDPRARDAAATAAAYGQHARQADQRRRVEAQVAQYQAAQAAQETIQQQNATEEKQKKKKGKGKKKKQ